MIDSYNNVLEIFKFNNLTIVNDNIDEQLLSCFIHRGFNDFIVSRVRILEG